MPAYDFRCTACRHTFEITRPVGETAPPECPECGSETKRVFTPVGVHFKGSGFYSTDSKRRKAEPKSEPKTDSPACPSAGSSGGCAGCPAASGGE